MAAGGPLPAHGPRPGGKAKKPAGRRHKVGAGLGLDKFAAAGAKQYDKRAKLDKERALNAAKVNAYKKLKKRLGDKLEPRRPLEQLAQDEEEEEERGVPQRQPAAPAAAPQQVQQDVSDEPAQQQQQQQQQQERGGGKRHKQHKPPSHVQRLAAEAQAEKEAAQREREERQAAAAARAAKLAADAKQRAAKSKKMFKRTAHGQPVMKYRMEAVLQQLEGGGTR